MIIVITTVDKKDTANRIAKELVEKKLAACVSIFPIRSTYYWKGKIEENQAEFMLTIKTLEEKTSNVIEYLKSNHPYAMPEIVTVKAEAHGKYVDWMVSYLLGIESP